MSTPRIGELFAGYGGLGMGVQAALGGEMAWYSEIDKGALKILEHRFPDVPNVGDITTVEWSQVEPVDILTGGSPCQDLSHAGKRAGMTEGTRSNLWVAMREAIAQLRPRLVIWENVRGAYSAEADSDLGSDPRRLADVRRRDGQPVLRALGRVLGDLSDLGYVGGWHGLRAADVGAPHGRFRVFVVAWDSNQPGLEGHGLNGERAGERLARATGSEPPLLSTPQARDWKGVPGETDVPCALLPTPNDFHMGNTESPDEWLIRRADVEQRTGTRHGPALPVVAWSVAEGRPLVQDGDGPHRVDGAGTWGPYAGAIAHWEAILGRAAPAPTQTSAKGNPQLSAAFVEWMMGLPAGWVTATPSITRNEALKALGNGVVPQQAEAAVRFLLSRTAASRAVA